MNSILFSFRQFRNWEDQYVAEKLLISLEEYIDLERGLENIDAEIALKLSELYKAPPEFFLSTHYLSSYSIIYTHCHFENSNGYVNHLYCDNLREKDELIKSLKEEIKRLQEQNNRLLDVWLKKIIDV